MKGSQTDRENRWAARPMLAVFVRASVVAIPLLVGAAAGFLVARLLPPPSGPLANFAWWVLVIGSAAITATLVDRQSRRLIPLGWLLEMSMLFPDQAPSRVSVARRTGNIAELRRRVASADRRGDTSTGEAAELVLSLATALSRHDPRTRGHAERTRIYTDLLAEDLGIDETDRDKLRWAALLHDIGKLEVPADVLNKKAPLSPEEWDLLKQHPIIGMELVEPLITWLGPWAQTIEHHHERWDGSGYPYGLQGTDIALGARVVAVADAFDVMTSGRAYQRAKAPDAARREIATMARSQFDPRVVRSLLMLSIGRLRLAAGPFAALAQIPVVRNGRHLGRDAVTVATSAAMMLALVITGVLGIERDLEAGGGGGAFGEVVAAPAGTDETEATPSTSTTDPATSTSSSPSTSSAPAPSTSGAPTTTDAPGTTTTTLPTTASTTDTPATTTTTTTTPTTSEPTATTSTTTPTEGPQGEGSTTTTGPPPAVVANPDLATTNASTPILIDVVANDTAGGGRVAVGSLTVVSAPATGTALVEGDLIRYTPNAAGRDSFRYRVCTPSDACGEASVTVTVLAAANGAPVASDTSLQTDWISSTAAAPASDPDGDTLTLSVTSSPAAGAVSVSGERIVYTPTLGSSGSFTIGYRACDPSSACDTGTVTVVVSGVAVARDDTASIPSSSTGNDARTIAVLANDYASNGPADQHPVTITITSEPAHGRILGLGGGVRYAVQSGYTGTDTFQYRICDGAGSCDAAAVVVTVS